MKNRILLLILLCGLGALLWWSYLRGQADSPEVTTSESRPSLPPSTIHHSDPTRGINPLASDGALPPLAWGELRPEYEQLLRDAPQITPHGPDDARFLELGDLLLWSIPVGLPGEDGRLAAECAAKYEPQLRRPCQWKTEYVVRRVGKEELAELGYIRVALAHDNDDPACFAFASCTANLWARQVDIPFPKSLGNVYAFNEFGRGARWNPSKGDREQFYQQALQEAKRKLDSFYSQGDLQEQLEDPIVRYNFEWNQRHVKEYESVLNLIKQQE